MDISLILTKDGSYTFRNDSLGEPYHSINGAITESMHVFINRGLKEHQGSDLRIFEVGFGTGLNALLSLICSETCNISINYSAIELYPLGKCKWSLLNYGDFCPPEYSTFMGLLHMAEWEIPVAITKKFVIRKIRADILNYDDVDTYYDIVYFDAFSPEIQPELWNIEMFRKIYSMMNWNGILVTYSAKGDVRRALEAAGFKTERLEGPQGKRHMLRAKKY